MKVDVECVRSKIPQLTLWVSGSEWLIYFGGMVSFQEVPEGGVKGAKRVGVRELLAQTADTPDRRVLPDSMLYRSQTDDS